MSADKHPSSNNPNDPNSSIPPDANNAGQRAGNTSGSSQYVVPPTPPRPARRPLRPIDPNSPHRRRLFEPEAPRPSPTDRVPVPTGTAVPYTILRAGFLVAGTSATVDSGVMNQLVKAIKSFNSRNTAQSCAHEARWDHRRPHKPD